jgi:hypothetical protein
MAEVVPLVGLLPLPTLAYQLRMVLHVPGPLPGLNEILAAQISAAPLRRSGKRPNGYTDLKRRWAATIKTIAGAEQIKHVPPACFTYVWCERDKRRDPSNFTAGGRKLIEDALQEAKLLDGDGWKHVLGFCDHWIVAPQRLGVCVIAADRLLEREEALELMTRQPPRYQRMQLPPALRPRARR